MCGVTWRRVGCIFRWYYVIVSHGAAALSFTVCAAAPVSASAAAAAAAVVSGQKSRCSCCLCHCRRQSGSRIWVSSVLQCGECAAFVAVWEFARPPSRHRQQHLHLQILGVSFGEISLSVCRLIWQGGNWLCPSSQNSQRPSTGCLAFACRTTKKKCQLLRAINKQHAEDEPALCDFVTFNPSPSTNTSTSTKGAKGQMSHLAYGKVVAAALADCGCFAIVIFLISRLMQSAASDCVRAELALPSVSPFVFTLGDCLAKT